MHSVADSFNCSKKIICLFLIIVFIFLPPLGSISHSLLVTLAFQGNINLATLIWQHYSRQCLSDVFKLFLCSHLGFTGIQQKSSDVTFQYLFQILNESDSLANIFFIF